MNKQYQGSKKKARRKEFLNRQAYRDIKKEDKIESISKPDPSEYVQLERKK